MTGRGGEPIETPSAGSGRQMLSVVHIESEPMTKLRFFNAKRGGGREIASLDVSQATVECLPADLDALVAAADLQGIIPDTEAGGVSLLLGVAVAETLEEMASEGLVPPCSRTGVLLAGDLFSVPEANRRGGYGDVSAVWRAFSDRFAFVAGVAGNHDDVRKVRGANQYVLDMEVRALHGIRIGGVGLIGGNPAKPGRRAENEQLEHIDLLTSEPLDVLVVHEGPKGEDGQLGHPRIAELVVARGVPLTICGHVHWREPLWRHPRGQVLNVDGRVVVLTR